MAGQKGIEVNLAKTIKYVGGNEREVDLLLALINKINPGWKSGKFADAFDCAVEAFCRLLQLNTSRFDGPQNRRRTWRLFLLSTLGVEIRMWQFACPPKIVLTPNGWAIQKADKYDILTPSIGKTRTLLSVMEKSGLPFTFQVFYPDDEIVKARASGLKLQQMDAVQKARLLDKLESLNIAVCLGFQKKYKDIDFQLWSDATAKLNIDTDTLFASETAFWQRQSFAGIGFFKETQDWLSRTFKFDPELAFELTARRLAKYATEGKLICRMYPQGSLYINNEFPFSEPWSMYTASVLPCERDLMACLWYM